MSDKLCQNLPHLRTTGNKHDVWKRQGFLTFNSKTWCLHTGICWKPHKTMFIHKGALYVNNTWCAQNFTSKWKVCSHIPILNFICSLKMLLLNASQNFTNVFCSILQICHSYLVISTISFERKYLCEQNYNWRCTVSKIDNSRINTRVCKYAIGQITIDTFPKTLTQ